MPVGVLASPNGWLVAVVLGRRDPATQGVTGDLWHVRYYHTHDWAEGPWTELWASSAPVAVSVPASVAHGLCDISAFLELHAGVESTHGAATAALCEPPRTLVRHRVPTCETVSLHGGWVAGFPTGAWVKVPALWRRGHEDASLQLQYVHEVSSLMPGHTCRHVWRMWCLKAVPGSVPQGAGALLMRLQASTENATQHGGGLVLWPTCDQHDMLQRLSTQRLAWMCAVARVHRVRDSAGST